MSGAMIVLAAFVLAAPPSSNSVSLFRSEADITLAPLPAADGAPAATLRWLVLPANVVTACSPDLSDLRIYDERGGLVPFVIDNQAASGGATAETHAEKQERVRAVVVEAKRTEELAVGSTPPTPVETYIMKPPGPGRWRMLLRVNSAQFVKDVSVTAVPETGSSGARRVLSSGSVFRLPAVHAEKDSVDFEWSPQPAAHEWLEVTLRGGGAALEPTIEFARDTSYAAVTREVLLPLSAERTVHGDTSSAYWLVRPAGVLTTELVMRTEEPFFERSVTVWDEGVLAQRQVLGKGVFFRIPELPAEDAHLTLLPPRGDHLRVVITNGDSPALTQTSFFAKIVQPTLVFAAAPQARLVLRFGGGRVRAANFDVQALLPARGAATRDHTVANAWQAVLERSPSAMATLREPRENAEQRQEAILAFAHRPGALVDERVFSKRAELAIGASRDGLVRVELPSTIWAAAGRTDLGDLRVLDAQARQWPYFLVDRARRAEHAIVSAEDEPGPRTINKTSTYAFDVPGKRLRAQGAWLRATADFVDREIVVRGQDLSGPESVLYRGRLVHSPDDPRRQFVPFDREAWLTKIWLDVKDGDDAPLDFEQVQLTADDADLYVVAPEGNYHLVLGDSHTPPPAYELDGARETILAARSEEATLDNLEENPMYSAVATFDASPGRGRVLLWVALVGTVLALAGLTLKLAQKEAT